MPTKPSSASAKTPKTPSRRIVRPTYSGPTLEQYHQARAEQARRDAERQAAQAELAFRDSKREAEQSLHAFVCQAWRIIVPNGRMVDNWHLMGICLHLMAITFGIITQLLINIPPRHSKSLIVSVFWPAWEWTDPERRTGFLATSHSQDLCTEHNRLCRQLIQSEWYQARWPHVECTTDQNMKRHFDLAGGGRREAVSAQGAVTGKGGDKRITDDLHDTDDSRDSIVERVKWWSETWSQRTNDLEKPIEVVIMQRCDEPDLSGHILATEPEDWVKMILPLWYEPERHCVTGLVCDGPPVITLPVLDGRGEPVLDEQGKPLTKTIKNWYVDEKDPRGWEDPRTEPGEIICEARMSDKAARKRERRMGPQKAAGNLQQRPSPAEGNIFKREHFQVRWHRLVAEDLEFMTSLDSPFDDTTGKTAGGKKKKKSDFFVIQLLAKLGPSYYLIDQVRGRMEFTAMETAMVDFITKWKRIGIILTRHLVEGHASGNALVSRLRKAISGLTLYYPKGSKPMRYRAVAPIHESGHFLIPADDAVLVVAGHNIALNPGFTGEYVEEMVTVPAAENDDQADATAQGLLYWEDPLNQPEEYVCPVAAL